MSAPITHHYHITQDVKEKAESILRKLGIPVSSALEMFYRQIIAHDGLPFETPIANETTIDFHIIIFTRLEGGGYSALCRRPKTQ